MAFGNTQNFANGQQKPQGNSKPLDDQDTNTQSMTNNESAKAPFATAAPGINDVEQQVRNMRPASKHAPTDDDLKNVHQGLHRRLGLLHDPKTRELLKTRWMWVIVAIWLISWILLKFIYGGQLQKWFVWSPNLQLAGGPLFTGTLQMAKPVAKLVKLFITAILTSVISPFTISRLSELLIGFVLLYACWIAGKVLGTDDVTMFKGYFFTGAGSMLVIWVFWILTLLAATTSKSLQMAQWFNNLGMSQQVIYGISFPLMGLWSKSMAMLWLSRARMQAYHNLNLRHERTVMLIILFCLGLIYLLLFGLYHGGLSKMFNAIGNFGLLVAMMAGFVQGNSSFNRLAWKQTRNG